jgi:chaperonin GroES
LKVGDRVLYQKYAGTEFKLDEDELLVLSQDDVLALIES